MFPTMVHDGPIASGGLKPEFGRVQLCCFDSRSEVVRGRFLCGRSSSWDDRDRPARLQTRQTAR